jgi:hypothetical protein
MTSHGDLRPNPGDPLIRTDQEGRAHDAHEFAPVHGLLLPYAISFEHAMGLVGGQYEAELVFGFELVLRWQSVGGNTEDFGPGFPERCLEPIEVDSLLGATRRIGPGVEIKNELAPGEIGERDGSSAIAVGIVPSFRRFPNGILA